MVFSGAFTDPTGSVMIYGVVFVAQPDNEKIGVCEICQDLASWLVIMGFRTFERTTTRKELVLSSSFGHAL
jgi:hypothetical protein